jgi:ABC-type spermidine/putrescine transport system permease subunit I
VDVTARTLPGRGKQWRGWRAHVLSTVFTAPAMGFLLVLFLWPVLRLMSLSVEGGSFASYEKALTDGLYLQVLLNTGLIAVYVSAVCLALGYPVAYFLANSREPWTTIGIVFVLLPFWTSILVRTYAWMVLLGRNGVINRFLLEAGLIAAPLPLLNNLTGVLIGMAHVLLPYMIFPLYAVMRRVDPGLLSAAEGLGAPGWQIFRRVYLPLTLPGVLAGVTLVFILSMGFFITPALLGGGKVIMIAVLIESQVRQFLAWDFAAALSVVLLVMTLVVYFGLKRLFRGDLQWG